MIRPTRRSTRLVLTVSSALLLLAGAIVAAVAFKPPDPDQRRRAVGPTDDLPQPLRRALEPGDAFEPIPSPGPNDWLANHPEDGQTFDDFVRGKPNRPDATRNKLYLLPLGAFSAADSPPVDKLQQFAAAYFAMPVEVLKPLDPAALKDAKVTRRVNPHTHKEQLHTTDLLDLLHGRLPADAFALLGVTMEDLYPDPKWNFVFGQASLRDRVGVYSFARYDPRFFGEKPEADRRDTQKLMLQRSCKVLAHETGHMFGIQHCVYYSCLMNGSNHLGEADARPMHECPVDLRKLQWSVGFDVLDRYKRLRDFAKANGLDDEAKWLDRRVGELEAVSAAR